MDEQIPPLSPTPSKPRTAMFVILGLALVAALAGAAFMAGRLMNRQAAQIGPEMMVVGGRRRQPRLAQRGRDHPHQRQDEDQGDGHGSDMVENLTGF